MTSRQRISVRVSLVAIVCLLAVCLVSNVTAFSMVRKYDNMNIEYPSDQLRDLLEFEYGAEEPLGPTPVKRQKNQGGTCTCTCETRPVNDDTPKTRGPAAQVSGGGSQYPEVGSLLRTGTGVMPQSAARVLEKPYHSKAEVKDVKPETKVNRPSSSSNNVDLNSQIIKHDPWDYSDMVNMEPSKQDDEEEVEEAKEEERPPPQPQQETKTTPASEIKTEQSSEQDAWGHGRRFPWKHLRNEMCFRESCKSDADCCMRYNLCDKSAKVCVDCWYGSTCTSEQDCCQRFPYCQRVWKKHQVTGRDYVSNGKCVSKLP